MYRRGTQDEDTGVITWSGPAIDISDGTAVERCFPALAVSDDAVHFAWRGTGNEVHYRRLRRDGGGWNFESVRVTGADGNSSDNGPDIAVYGDDEIHVIARSMEYAYSRDGGLSWDAEDLSSRLPPGNIGFKYPALTVDPRGHVHVLVTSRLRDNYWPLWYMHRERPTTGGPGGWLEEHHPFSDKPDWQDPGAGGPDLFLDWVDIESDDAGNLHIGWHGTFFTGVFAQDDAFYATRAFVDDGDAAAWSDPQALHRANPGTNFFSFTPSIATDSASDSTFAVFMIKALGLAPADNYDDLDSGLRILRNGSFIDNALSGSGDYIALSDAANWSVATWWPTTAPRLHRHPSGRVWLDVLQSMLHGASSDDFALIVHQRYEVTEVLGAPVDSDMDGVPDVQDQFPNDPAESVDTDGDGIGDNADTDDDGDGVPDVRDAFSLDPDESVDTDRDGVGNNADTDDDGDGTPDAEDAFPLDPSRSTEPSSENPPAEDPPAEEPAGEVEEPVIDGGVDDGTSGSSAGAQDSGAGDSGGSALGFIALALLVLAGSVVRSRRGRRPSAAR